MWLWGHLKYHVTLKVTLTFGVKGKVNVYSFFIVWFLNSWPHHFKFSTIVGKKRNFRFWRYNVINIFKLEYIRYLLSHADQTGFDKRWMTVYFLKNIFYVTSSHVDMPSLKFQLRISFLFYVGFSHNLVKEIWLVHMTLRSYKISCEIEGHVDLWS